MAMCFAKATALSLVLVRFRILYAIDFRFLVVLICMTSLSIRFHRSLKILDKIHVLMTMVVSLYITLTPVSMAFSTSSIHIVSITQNASSVLRSTRWTHLSAMVTNTLAIRMGQNHAQWLWLSRHSSCDSALRVLRIAFIICWLALLGVCCCCCCCCEGGV